MLLQQEKLLILLRLTATTTTTTTATATTATATATAIIQINKTSTPDQKRLYSNRCPAESKCTSSSFARNTPLRFRTVKTCRRLHPPDIAPNLSPAESKCTLKSFRCALLCAADIRRVQNETLQREHFHRSVGTLLGLSRVRGALFD